MSLIHWIVDVASFALLFGVFAGVLVIVVGLAFALLLALLDWLLP